MQSELQILMVTAAGIGIVHTLLGPDHYLPFVAMSRGGKWSLLKTSLVTAVCGLGHVGGSVALGFIGIFFGYSISGLSAVEEFRGGIAAWLLIAFGLVYLVWGLRKAHNLKKHEHPHTHEDGVIHSHPHVHTKEHLHPHLDDSSLRSTPWVLFVVFAFGPCEALIPLLMYPAATIDLFSVVAVVVVFGAATITTMLMLVIGLHIGLSQIPIRRFSNYAHAIAGATVLLCGAGIQFLGL